MGIGCEEDLAWHFLAKGAFLLYIATSAAFLNKMDGVYKLQTSYYLTYYPN